MELIADNLTMTDCLIVATHNALALVGRPTSYKRIKNLCTKKGWYREGHGFTNAFLGDLFSHYKLDCTPVYPGMTTQEISETVGQGTNYFILCEPYYGGTGHAMIATKGKVGVKLINTNAPPHGGWRSLCKDIKLNYVKVLAFEIKGRL